MAATMHADEVETDASLVRRLLSAQFPRWADLPITAVPSAGTDNAIYRLGDHRAVRLPRIHWAAGQAEKEQRWLPALAPLLPLAIPHPLVLGEPGEGYPWRWSVQRWLAGENATIERLAAPADAAVELARFIIALHRIAPADGPPAGPGNFFRGVPLVLRDAPTRAAIAALQGLIDTDAVTAVWDSALRSPAWREPPVWVHGDLSSGNLLAMRGHLSAVIDFGCLGVGDPACDLIVAWSLFSGASREAFRATLAVDDAAWARGRGWALSGALIALPYYMHTNPTIVSNAWRTIDAALGDAR